MEIIILGFIVFWILRSSIKGLFSVGTGKAYKPGKDSKPFGITHYLVSIIEGCNPAKDDTKPVFAWLFSKILKVVQFVFWVPNWISGHWIKRKWLQNLCTIIFWLLLALVIL